MGQVLNLILILVLVCFLVGSVILVVAAAMDNEKTRHTGLVFNYPAICCGGFDIVWNGMCRNVLDSPMIRRNCPHYAGCPQ